MAVDVFPKNFWGKTCRQSRKKGNSFGMGPKEISFLNFPIPRGEERKKKMNRERETQTQARAQAPAETLTVEDLNLPPGLREELKKEKPREEERMAFSCGICSKCCDH